MCGFYGISGGSREDVERGLREIRHRGPDSSNIIEKDDTILGHVRLSILGLDSGFQPIKVNSGYLAFNGEIYNFHELINRYNLDPNLNSDTEVLARLYDILGFTKLLKEIRGMFAIVIVLKNEILLARDRYGQKPLYYHLEDGIFQFGSDVLSFKLDKNLSSIDPTSLNFYMSFGFIPAPHSIWKGVKKLEPGEFIKYNTETNEILRDNFYSIFDSSFKNSSNFSDLVAQAVDKHSISDVGSSMLLSGGVDSSILASFARSETNLYTVKWKDVEYDESSNATSIAESLNRKLNIIETQEDKFGDNLREIIKSFGEPFADDSIISLDNVLRAIAIQGEKVVLSGDGADEIFGGYNRYNIDLYLKFIPQFVIRLLMKNTDTRSLRYTQLSKLLELKSITNLFDRHYRISQLVLSDKERKAILFEHSDIKSELVSHMRHIHSKSEKQWKNIFDLRFLVEGNMMVKGDRISMKNSLELRVPFLDEYLVTRAIDYHKSHIRFGIKKFYLKRIFVRIFGFSRLQRKMGFGAPLLTDFGEEYYTELEEVLQNEELKIWRLLSRLNTKEILASQKGNFKRFSFAIIVLSNWLEKEIKE